MIGIIVPAHNEEALLPICLRAIDVACAHPDLRGENSVVIVAADACSDDTVAVGREAGVIVTELNARCVGLARKQAVALAIGAGARWIASTDADTLVPPDWLVAQLLHRSDAVCGTVQVEDWSGLAPAIAAGFYKNYRNREGHNHIHGANLSFSAEAYMRAGGFEAVSAHEDVLLVRKLESLNCHIAWTASPCVTTSARADFRAPIGFGATIHAVAA